MLTTFILTSALALSTMSNPYPSDVHLLTHSELSVADQSFYDSFREDLLTIPRSRFIQLNKAEQKKAVVADLKNQYVIDSQKIKARFPSMPSDELWLSFIMLKVDGAKPIYSTNNGKLSIKSLLYSPYSECQTFALTTATLLKFHGKQAQIMGFETNRIFGHVVTTYYDQEKQKAYLIDSNSNFMAVYRNATGPFDQMLRDHTIEQIKTNLVSYQFPFYERYFKFDTRYTSDWTQQQKDQMLVDRNGLYAPRLADGFAHLADDKAKLIESFSNPNVGVPTGVFPPKQGAKNLGWSTYNLYWYY